MPTKTHINQNSSIASEPELLGVDSLSLQNDSLLLDSTFFYKFTEVYPVRIPLYVDSVSSVEVQPPPPVDYNHLIEHTEGYGVLEMMARNSHEGHRQFPSKDGTPLHQNIQMQVWFTPFLFLLFVLYGIGLAFSRYTFWREVKGLFFLSLDDDFYGNTAKEEFQSKVFLFLLSVINIALFIYFCFNGVSSLPVNYPIVLGAFVVFVLLFSLGKILFLRLICYTFFDPKIYMRVERTFLLVRSLEGIVLIPVLLMVAYSPSVLLLPALYVGGGVCVFLSAIYLLKMVSFFFKGTFSLFYLILYLCTVEILPVIALIFGLFYILKA